MPAEIKTTNKNQNRKIIHNQNKFILIKKTSMSKEASNSSLNNKKIIKVPKKHKLCRKTISVPILFSQISFNTKFYGHLEKKMFLIDAKFYWRIRLREISTFRVGMGAVEGEEVAALPHPGWAADEEPRERNGGLAQSGKSVGRSNE